MNQKLQKCLTYLKTKGSHGLHAEAMRKPSNNPLPPVDENRHLLKLNGTALALGWSSVGILIAFNCLHRTGDSADSKDDHSTACIAQAIARIRKMIIHNRQTARHQSLKQPYSHQLASGTIKPQIGWCVAAHRLRSRRK